jgi:hypothetical protein
MWDCMEFYQRHSYQFLKGQHSGEGGGGTKPLPILAASGSMADATF